MSTRFDVDASEFDDLTVGQQQQLSELLDAYLASLECGEPLDRAQLVAGHPELAGPIRAYLASLEFLQDAAAGFVPAALSPDLQLPGGDDVSAEAGTFSSQQGVAAGQQGAGHASVDERRIGDFRVLDEIGRGGMGIVYEAWQLSLDRRVALKVLPFASLLDGKQIARFRNEAQAAARLHHPNIVPVFAVGTDRGVHYYAMQYVDGQPLDRVIAALRQRGRIPAQQTREADAAFVDPTEAEGKDPIVGSPVVGSSETGRLGSGPQLRDVLTTTYQYDAAAYFQHVARLGVDAALAIHAAHEEGIVHRDIKPSNLLLDVDGKVWVADFGLARCRTDSNLTGSGDLVGTMRYMSPEQARGSGAIVDHRTDVYSLGATLYELLTLRHAVRGKDAAAIVRRLDQDEPHSPRQWDAKIPVDLETIVLKAIAKSPATRYATAQALAEDLHRFLAGQPVRARRPTLSDRLGKWVLRHQRAVAVALLVMLFSVVGLAIGTALLSRQGRRTAHALAAAQENYQQYRRQLARTTNHLAMLKEQQGDGRGAAAAFGEAARLQREILAEDPRDEATLRDLAATLNNLGFFRSRRDTEGATRAYGEAIDVLRRLAELAPANPDVQIELALAISNLGSHCRRTGNPGRAVALLREACGRFQSLNTTAALRARDPHDLAVCYNNLGMAESDLNRLDAAEASLRVALRAAQASSAGETLVSAAPTRAAEPSSLDRPSVGPMVSAARQSAMGGIYFNLGIVQEKQGRLRDAAESFAWAVRLQGDAHRQAPHVGRFCRLLDRHYVHGGKVLRQLGDFQQAAAWTSARQALWPQDPRHLWSVAEEWAALANAAADRGSDPATIRRGLAAEQHQAEAMTTLRRAIALGLTPNQDMVDTELANLSREADDVRAWFATATSSS